MNRLFSFFSLCLCLGTFPALASADTIQLVGVGGASVNGVYIYPYQFSINGSSTNTAMLCLDYNREITMNEKWEVTTSHLALDNSQTSVDYRALALIDYVISNTPASSAQLVSDLQFADWDIFDPNDVNSNSAYTANAAAIKNNALALATSTQMINSGFYNAFTLFSPDSNQTGWTDGIPQEFLEFTANSLPNTFPPDTIVPTPEPSSLFLFGSGLISVAGLVRRRMKQS